MSEAVAREQQDAKALWESLPDGTPVFVQFLGGEPRPARRTEIGWESDDGLTAYTPWSVRVHEVWVPATSVAAAVSAAQADNNRRIEALAADYAAMAQDGFRGEVWAARYAQVAAAVRGLRAALVSSTSNENRS